MLLNQEKTKPCTSMGTCSVHMETVEVPVSDCARNVSFCSLCFKSTQHHIPAFAALPRSLSASNVAETSGSHGAGLMEPHNTE